MTKGLRPKQRVKPPVPVARPWWQSR